MHFNILTLQRTLIVLGFTLSLCTVVALIANTHASAQSAANGGQALEIGPPAMNLAGNPGDKINTTINIRNISPDNVLVTARVDDFISNGEDGTPKILVDTTETSPYSFKAWVGFIPQLTLKTRELKSVPITITIPSDASPGGFFGVVRFTPTAPGLDSSGVALSASIGSLIFLTVNGETTQKVSIEEFSINRNGKTGTFFETAPLQFVERIKNEGNIHEEPVGLVTIKDMFGNVLATLPVNAEQLTILPASIRKFEQPLDETVIGNRMLFGVYTAELSMTYGPDKQVVTTSKSFWVIPYTLIGVMLIAIIGGFFFFRFLIRRYNQSVIKKSQKRK